MRNAKSRIRAFETKWRQTGLFVWRAAPGSRATFVLTLATAVLLVPIGCGRKKEPSAAQTAQALEQSFKAAEPETQRAVAAATTAIKAASTATDVEAQREQYIQALQPATAVASQGRLSPEQVKALQQVYIQVQQANARNPKLDSQNFYNARAALAIQLKRNGVLP
jgi:hypothetical protein